MEQSQKSPPQQPQAETATREKIAYDLSEMKPWREFAVILFNDEEHTFQQVEIQLMRALECQFALAQSLAHRVHARGHAVVAITNHDRAFRIAGILKQIELRVALRRIN